MSALTTAIQSTTSTPTSNSSSSGSSQSTSQLNAFNEQDFMKMLTAQLQHQDPTHPMNEQQLASEMAQFSTATGVDTLNSNVSQLIAGQKADSLAKASSLIGKQVMTSGDALVANNQGQAQGAFNLSGAASDVKINVLDSSGKTVGYMDLGSQSAGTHTFNWDKGSPNQAYQFSIQAANSQGTAVPSTTASLYKVNGVSSSNNSIKLTLDGSPNSLALSQVQQVI